LIVRSGRGGGDVGVRWPGGVADRARSDACTQC